MSFGLFAFNFLTANIWRTVSLCMALILIGLCLTIRFYSYKLEGANIDLQRKEVEFTKIKASSMVQQESIRIASEELTRLRKRQAEDATKIKQLFDAWPNDCDDAGVKALQIIQGREK